MIPALPLTFATALRLTAVAVAVWCTLSSLEWAVALPSLGSGRALGRELGTLRKGPLGRRPWSHLLAGPSLALLIVARLLAGLGVAFAGQTVAAALLFAAIAILTGLLSLATDGGDGADKIAIVACSAALLIVAGRIDGDRLLSLAGIAWGAGQLTIAYFTSGAAKLARPFWRDGTAIGAAMTSYRSGQDASAAFVGDANRARCLAWTVILAELLFPVALVAPPDLCLAFLGLFAAFHVATAVVMGLSTYPWAFVSTYPCLLMANAMLNDALGLWHGGAAKALA